MCNRKAALRDFYQLKSSKSLLHVHRAGIFDIVFIVAKT